MIECTRCPLAQTRTSLVPGEGPVPARVMILGEGPGRQEDETGRPFVGKAGAVLDEALRAAGHDRSEFYVTNVLKCRPPGNRKPRRAEVAACRDVLLAELGRVKPELVIALGESAVKALDPAQSLDVARRNVFDAGPFRYTASFHPAATLHQPRFRLAFFADIRRALGVEGSEARLLGDYVVVEGVQAPPVEVVPGTPIAIDTEYDPDEGNRFLGFSWSWAEGVAMFVAHTSPLVEGLLRRVLDIGGPVIAHNLKADAPVVEGVLGTPFPWERAEDSLLQAYVLRKPQLALKDLAMTELGLRVTRLEDLTGSGKRRLKVSDVPMAQLGPYGAQDADLTLRLWHLFNRQLRES